MAEKKVPYQVNGRQFDGIIVYDDSVKAKRRRAPLLAKTMSY